MLTINKININNQIPFKQHSNYYRRPNDMDLMTSSPDTIILWRQSNKEALKPDYVLGEEGLFPFLTRAFKRVFSTDPATVRQGLDDLVDGPVEHKRFEVTI